MSRLQLMAAPVIEGVRVPDDASDLVVHRYSTVQYSTVQYSTVQYSTVAVQYSGSTVQ